MMYYLKSILPLIAYNLIFIINIVILGSFVKDYNFQSFFAYTISFIVIFIIFKSLIVNIKVEKIDGIKLIFSLITVVSFLLLKYIFTKIILVNTDENFSSNNSFSYIDAFTTIIIAPIFEEIIMCTIMEKWLKDGKKVLVIILLISFVFGIFHLPNFYSSIVLFFLGLIMAYTYYKTRNVLYPIIIHSIYNFFIFYTTT